MSKNLKDRLDIVLPCYNPSESWTQRIYESVAEIQARLPQTDLHVILVNDGSLRGISPTHIDFLHEKISHFSYLDVAQNVGKGAALRRGISYSKAEICIFTDVDFPYQTESFLNIYQQLQTGESDIAIGIKDPSYYSHLPALRIRVSKFLRFLARSFLRISITDTQCGLKGFNQKGKAIFLKTTIKRYLADLEFIFLSDREKDIRMKAIAVSLKPGVQFSKVNVKILLGEGINFLRVFIRSFFS